MGGLLNRQQIRIECESARAEVPNVPDRMSKEGAIFETRIVAGDTTILLYTLNKPLQLWPIENQ